MHADEIAQSVWVRFRYIVSEGHLELDLDVSSLAFK